MEEKDRKTLALFRYGVIADLVRAAPPCGRAALRRSGGHRRRSPAELARRLVRPRLLFDPPPYRAPAALRGPRELQVAFDRLDD